MKIPWFKIFRVILFLVVAIVTIGALAIAWFGYQGRKEWAKTRAELLARGEKLALSDMMPPEIPPEENFFADPLWEELFDLVPNETPQGGNFLKPRLPKSQQQISQLARTLNADEIQSLKQQFPEFALIVNDRDDNLRIVIKQWPIYSIKSSIQSIKPVVKTRREAEFILALLAPSSATLQRFAELAKRSSARAPIRYEDNISAELPHINGLLRGAQALRLRAEARLTLGDSTGALMDTLLIFHLSRTLETEPFLISLLVRASIYQYAIDVIKRGVFLWSETELKEIEQTLEKIDISINLSKVLRGERGGMNIYFDSFRGKPSHLWEILKTINGMANLNGETNDAFINNLFITRLVFYIYYFTFLDSDRAFWNLIYQEKIDSWENGNQNSQAKSLKTVEQGIEEKLNVIHSKPWDYAKHLFSASMMPAFAGSGIRVSFIQTEIRQAIIACTLQRWLLVKGSLPDKLNALVPDYLPTLPSDIMTGGPMHYRRTSDNTYDLWSVGWNETDEGGMPCEIRKLQEADWVWNPVIGM